MISKLKITFYYYCEIYFRFKFDPVHIIEQVFAPMHMALGFIGGGLFANYHSCIMLDHCLLPMQ